MGSLLWQPLQVRNLIIPNRIVMGSMHLGVEGDHNGIEKMISFYKERALGGAGLIITGGIAVNKEGAGGAQFLYLDEDRAIEQFRPLTKEIIEAGGRIAAQLFHAGRYADQKGTGYAPVAPSPIQARINVFKPRELTNEEIIRTINDYKEAARRAKLAGFHAIEIMGSEGYLINQFLSPLTNKREDEWGGDFEKRTRFAIEIVREVRKAVGDDYPIIFRISGLDLMPDSTTMEETIKFALMLEQAGVDILNVGIGWHESLVPTIGMFVPRGAYAWVAATIRRQVKIPVIASNRINKLELAEKILFNEEADLVSMARPFLADPYFLKKGKEKNFGDIKTCVGCNQACLDHVFTGKPVSCVVNPKTGRETEELWAKELKKDLTTKRIAVIGSGPAGLEAARVLALRGAKVTIFEKKEFVGGQLYYAKQIPGKSEWEETLKYYQKQIAKLDIELRLGIEVNAEMLLADRFDHYIVATGSMMKKPEIKGVNLPHVVNYEEVLERKVKVGKNVAIIGAGGIAVDLAHFLIERSTEELPYLLGYQVLKKLSKELYHTGRNITIMRRKGRIGNSLGITTRWAILGKLTELGVSMLTGVEYQEITKEGVIIKYKGEVELIKADTVILATGQVENNSLYNDLLTRTKNLSLIGGAKEVSELDAKNAIFQGAVLGREFNS